MAIVENHTDPTICPVCGTKRDKSENYDFNDERFWFYYRCSNCYAEWTDVYNLKQRYIELL